MNYFLGLDLSLTCSGYCLINQNGKKVLSGTVTTTASGEEIKSRFWRYNFIAFTLLNKIFPTALKKKEQSIKTIAIETASFGSKGSRKTQLIENSAVVTQAMMKEINAEWIEVAPISLKKFINGSVKSKGKESKNIMCREVYIKYGEKIDDDNEVDAFSLAQVARTYWKIINKKGYDGDIYKYQYEVVNNIIKKRNEDMHDKEVRSMKDFL